MCLYQVEISVYLTLRHQQTHKPLIMLILKISDVTRCKVLKKKINYTSAVQWWPITVLHLSLHYKIVQRSLVACEACSDKPTIAHEITAGFFRWYSYCSVFKFFCRFFFYSIINLLTAYEFEFPFGVFRISFIYLNKFENIYMKKSSLQNVDF